MAKRTAKSIAPKNVTPVWNASALQIRRAYETLGKSVSGLTYEAMANEIVKMMGSLAAWTFVSNIPTNPNSYTFEEWCRKSIELNSDETYTKFYVPTIANWMEACRMNGTGTVMTLDRCKHYFTN